MIASVPSGGTPPGRPPRRAFDGLEAVDPAAAEHDQRRLLAVILSVHELLKVSESPMQFLDGCARHLVRIGMMPALWDGKVDAVGPEVVEVLVAFAHPAYVRAARGGGSGGSV